MPELRSTRRTFLASSSAALAVAALPQHNQLEPRPKRPGVPAHAKKKILVLGGTSFLGPAVVTTALANGHEITLFNRGKTNPGLFPNVEKLHGQRRRPRPTSRETPRRTSRRSKAASGMPSSTRAPTTRAKSRTWARCSPATSANTSSSAR
jgi:hypothetical protein